MNKYINTDRLLTEIERLYAENKVEWKLTGSSYHEGAMDMLDKIEQLVDSLQQEQPDGYFFCKFGGMLPKCADCARNHANSPYTVTEIDAWMRPGTLGTKQCSDYIRKDESELDNPGTEFELNDVKSKK